MALDGHLAQLSLLREMVASAVPRDSPGEVEAHHLSATYVRLRGETRRFAESAGISVDDVDRRLPEIKVAARQPSSTRFHDVQAHQVAAEEAAALLRQLEGWVNGVFDAVALEQGHDLAEIERARSERRR